MEEAKYHLPYFQRKSEQHVTKRMRQSPMMHESRGLGMLDDFPHSLVIFTTEPNINDISYAVRRGSGGTPSGSFRPRVTP